MKTPIQFRSRVLTLIALVLVATPLWAQDISHFEQLADLPLENNRATPETAQTLKDELLFQRAGQTYLWAMPLLNTMGMRDGFKESFGSGYNVMAIWEKRLDAKTHITTPNSDLIYGMVFADLAETGPLVFEAPPKLQGILLDFWQRPIPVDGGKFFGDLGLPGPDGGAGGKFLLLPPGYDGDVPGGYYVYRSGTNNVFIFLRSFYQSLDNIQPAVDVLKQSVFYPLGKKDSAKPMVFHDASGKAHEMLPRNNASAFDQLKWLVDSEGEHLAGPDWLGMLAGLGIVEGESFEPDDRTRKILDQAARTAYKTSRVIGMERNLGGADFRVYKDRQWLNPINNLTSRWPNSFVDLSFTDREHGLRNLDARAWFFTDYYSISPGMVSMTPGKGAFYMIAFKDAKGEWLNGENNYTLDLPPDIPAALFWSVTLYEAENASGLDNGQPFPSLGKLNEPAKKDDGSITLYLGPRAPEGKNANWLATVPGRGYFAILRLYAPTEPAINMTWKPGDIQKAN
ncbi:DUF1254 domain-containing protein [Roseiconus nitratireducens]|uniref:DUF1254 domain-containing protein n=1 Tax=Roseiconus nitratireducens TaxID=2605748 RepID=A0A5M6D8L9_9BACT|nr:DUF1254 domain-containing protein [Roseiconus nitratireducens]KAA5542662.1 DUF1254 domain-containing protein [Roseiconus nitratireducens]